MANPNGNIKNLDPVRTKEEARKRGRAGGIASGEARRKKRDAKKCIKLALDNVARGTKTKETAQQILGLESPDEVTNRDVMIARLVVGAISGNMRATQMLLEYAGETPGEKRAEKAEKREAKKFNAQINALENIDKDNDNVLKFINAMSSNVIKPDESIRRERENNKSGDTDGEGNDS